MFYTGSRRSKDSTLSKEKSVRKGEIYTHYSDIPNKYHKLCMAGLKTF